MGIKMIPITYARVSQLSQNMVHGATNKYWSRENTRPNTERTL
jgi:hypothetical protein